MRRPVRSRLTVCLATVVVTTALGALAAPAASADPERATLLPGHVYDSNASSPGRVADVPPFGRKLG